MEKNKKEKTVRDHIIIENARVNNLKNVSIKIPRDQFVVVTGLSGSGKSSLVFDTIFAEGNRRYVEGLSSYARNFLDVGAKPDVDKIENLSPPISIDQRSISRSPRSTVGTLTEIYDYLRVLYSKIGVVRCSDCGVEMRRTTSREILDDILTLPNKSHVAILALMEHETKTTTELLRYVQQLGYARVRFNGKIMTVTEALMIVSDRFNSPIEIVVDRLMIDEKRPDKERILDSIETTMKIGSGSMIVCIDGTEDRASNQDFLCNQCGVRIKEVTPRHFSFNNPEGACDDCSGLGVRLEVDPDLVIPNKNLSIEEGAIQPWSKSGGKSGTPGSQMAALRILAEKMNFSLSVPVRRLSAKNLEAILFGTSDKRVIKNFKNDLGGIMQTSYAFEGVVPSMEKKYQETKSDYMRSEMERYMLSRTCPSCEGKRLKKEYLSVLIQEKSIDDLVNLNINRLKDFLGGWTSWKLTGEQQKVSSPIIKEVLERLKALEDVGLEYINMARSSQSISGGEAQRVRLAVQLKSQLMGIVYVLDEPSIGLHNRDTEKLIATIKSLRDAGNSLIVVEHDKDIIQSSDWVVDMGPGAGEEGGEIIFEGTPSELTNSDSLTGKYLRGEMNVSEKSSLRKGTKQSIEIIGATEHNLKNISVSIPLGKFVTIAGVSGSGKSTLVSDILAKALSKNFYKSKAAPGAHQKIAGMEYIDKVISVNQDPIGRTPRSNAATYTGVFSHIRELFSNTEEAKNRRYTPSQFSFNMKGGRCEFCQGDGMRKIEMHLMPDVYVKCEACNGARFNQRTREIEYRGMNIAEVLDMSVSYAARFFQKHPLISEKLKTIEEVGLGYLKLGQSAPNLSGGEAQRIKLATELARKSTGRTLYILDEPTIGLHFDDVRRLLQVLDALVDKGNSVLVVEHNIDVIRNSDWVIELGPDGGEKGGKIVFEGTPDKLAKNKKSWTGKYL